MELKPQYAIQFFFVIPFYVVDVHFFLDWSVRQHASGEEEQNPVFKSERSYLTFIHSSIIILFFLKRIR